MPIRSGALLSVSWVVFAACGGGGDDANDFTGVTVPLQVVENGVFVSAPLTVGSQTFHSQIDTGSSVTGIAAAACGSACAGVSPLYTPSTTATDKQKTDQTEYADMSGWSGEIFEDTAGVSSDTQVTLDFVAISDQTMFFAGNAYQGIVGLGPTDLLDPGTTSYPELVGKTGIDEVLAFQMCPDKGQMFIGGFDASATSGPEVLTPMVAITAAQPFYAVHVATLALGDTVLSTSEAAIGDTLVDTGTSFSYVPTAVANKVLAAVNGDAGFAALFPGQAFSDSNQDCISSSTVTTAQVDAMLPKLKISFPTVDGTTAPTVMELDPSRSYIYVAGGGTFCLSLDDSGGSASDGSVIGDMMQQSFVSVFDTVNKQIGFAPEAGCASANAQSAAADVAGFAPGGGRPTISLPRGTRPLAKYRGR